MSPSILFHEMKTAIKNRKLDIPFIMELQSKPWPTICKELNLSLNLQRAFHKNEGRAVFTVVVQSLIREDTEGFENELETEQDIRIVQGWGR